MAEADTVACPSQQRTHGQMISTHELSSAAAGKQRHIPLYHGCGKSRDCTTALTECWVCVSNRNREPSPCRHGCAQSAAAIEPTSPLARGVPLWADPSWKSRPAYAILIQLQSFILHLVLHWSKEGKKDFSREHLFPSL